MATKIPITQPSKGMSTGLIIALIAIPVLGAVGFFAWKKMRSNGDAGASNDAIASGGGNPSSIAAQKAAQSGVLSGRDRRKTARELKKDLKNQGFSGKEARQAKREYKKAERAEKKA